MNKKDINRFWSFVKKTNECWEWSGGINSTGRGIFWLNNKTPKAHRISWTLNFGEIPKGLLVLHHCDNGKCVNPEHLFLGTYKDNTQDMIKKGRRGGNRKLTDKQISQIRSKWSFRKYTQKRLAKEFNVNVCTINRICV